MILYRYFAKEVFSTMVAVAGIVLVISMGWRFSGYLNEAAAGQLSQDILFLLIAYRLPGFLELILPISFFLSVMLTYGRLHVDSEMVVLESCGMSPAKLIWMTLVLAFMVMLLTASVTLVFKPLGEARAAALFADQRAMTEFDTLAPGRFQNLRSGKRVTYAERLSETGVLQNVFINEYQTRSSGREDVITVQADSGATMVDGQGNRFLVLKNGTRYNGIPGQADYRVIKYEEYGQFIERGQSDAGVTRRTAIPTKVLLAEPSAKHTSELHWRISVIVMIPIIAVLAIPLSRVSPRQGRFSRLLPGMLLCFLYVVSLSTGRSALEAGRLPMAAGLWWVHLIYLFIIFLLYNMGDFVQYMTQSRHAKQVAP